jgi:hypothetical protein
MKDTQLKPTQWMLREHSDLQLADLCSQCHQKYVLELE